MRCVNQTPQGTEPIVCIYSKEIYYKALIHAIMKVEESDELPSVSWRPRKDGDVVQRPANLV